MSQGTAVRVRERWPSWPDSTTGEWFTAWEPEPLHRLYSGPDRATRDQIADIYRSRGHVVETEDHIDRSNR